MSNRASTQMNFGRTKKFFSQREMVCLIYVLQGRTALQIGKILSISVKTAEFYIASIKAKLGCTSKSDLFDWAYQMGVIKFQQELLAE